MDANKNYLEEIKRIAVECWGCKHLKVWRGLKAYECLFWGIAVLPWEKKICSAKIKQGD